MIRDYQRHNRVYESEIGFPIECEAISKIISGGDFLNVRAFENKIVFEADYLMGVIDFDTKEEIYRIESKSYFDVPKSVDNDVAYMIAHGRPAAINLTNGQIIWDINNEELILGASTSSIYCYDGKGNRNILISRSKKTGEISWENASIEGSIGDMAFENDSLMLLSSAKLYRIDITNGCVKWSLTVDELSKKKEKRIESVRLLINLGPLIDGVQYLSVTNGPLCAVNILTGEIIWESRFEIPTFPHNIFYHDSTLIFDYFQGFGKENCYFIVAADSGKLLFRSEEMISPKGSAFPIITNGYVVGGNEEYLSFFDIEKKSFTYRYKQPNKAKIFNFIQPYKNKFIAWNAKEKEIYWFKTK